MKMKQRKQWLTFISIVTVIGIGAAFVLMTSKSQVITETDVRNQLSSLYDAEVADVRKTKDVYTAVIKKSGSAYLVEMNPKNGKIFSLQPTEEQPISKEAQSTSSNVSEKDDKELPTSTKSKTDTNNKQSTSTGHSNSGKKHENISVSPKESGSKNRAAREKEEIPTGENEVSIQELPMDETESATASEETENQPTNTETVATNDTKQASSEEKKDEQTSSEVAKEAVKDNKAEPELSEENTITIATIDKSKDDESAKEAQPSSLYISKKKAIRIALEQYKGSFEKLSFEKKEDGGFYLITLKDVTSEKESKEKQKATVQVHAISGKILSVTWE